MDRKISVSILAALAVLGLLLIFIIIRTKKLKAVALKNRNFGKQGAAPTGKSTLCPLCKNELYGQEKVRSVVYRGKPDSIMEISGCPRCYPPNSDNPRICPVCSRILKQDSVLIARYFEKPGRKHVHVLGCSTCYRNPANRVRDTALEKPSF